MNWGHMSVGLSMSDVAEQGGVTAGSLLREARQASGLHIAALAVALKVPVSKLEALEADDYAALPDTVFVRALASSVCRTLKLEPGPVLSLLPQSKSPRLSADSAGLNAPVKGTGVRSGGGGSSGTSAPKSVVFLVAVLLIGALVVLYLPSGTRLDALQPTQAPAVPPVLDVPAPLSAPSPATVATAGASEHAPAAGAPPAAPVASVARPAVSVAEPVAATASMAVAATSASSATPAANVSGDTLVLRASAESWVQVRDGAGVSLLQRKLAAGEAVSVGGSMPMTVVVGRADATEVFVRGKPFDLGAVSRENVARFEVK